VSANTANGFHFRVECADVHRISQYSYAPVACRLTGRRDRRQGIIVCVLWQFFTRSETDDQVATSGRCDTRDGRSLGCQFPRVYLFRLSGVCYFTINFINYFFWFFFFFSLLRERYSLDRTVLDWIIKSLCLFVLSRRVLFAYSLLCLWVNLCFRRGRSNNSHRSRACWLFAVRSYPERPSKTHALWFECMYIYIYIFCFTWKYDPCSETSNHWCVFI